MDGEENVFLTWPQKSDLSKVIPGVCILQKKGDIKKKVEFY